MKGAASREFYAKFEALSDGVIDLKAQEEESGIEHYIRVRSLTGKVFDSSWHRIKVSGSGEVRMTDLSKAKDLGIAGWLKGQK